jgi:hypothetical protein
MMGPYRTAPETPADPRIAAEAELTLAKAALLEELAAGIRHVIWMCGYTDSSESCAKMIDALNRIYVEVSRR